MDIAPLCAMSGSFPGLWLRLSTAAAFLTIVPCPVHRLHVSIAGLKVAPE